MLGEMVVDERPRGRLKPRGSAALSDGRLSPSFSISALGAKRLLTAGSSTGYDSPAARSHNDAISTASYSWIFLGRPRRRCPSAEGDFPFRVRGPSSFRTATK